MTGRNKISTEGSADCNFLAIEDGEMDTNDHWRQKQIILQHTQQAVTSPFVEAIVKIKTSGKQRKAREDKTRKTQKIEFLWTRNHRLKEEDILGKETNRVTRNRKQKRRFLTVKKSSSSSACGGSILSNPEPRCCVGASLLTRLTPASSPPAAPMLPLSLMGGLRRVDMEMNKMSMEVVLRCGTKKRSNMEEKRFFGGSGINPASSALK